MTFQCAGITCNPFGCRAYFRCSPETRAMRRAHDALVAQDATYTGSTCPSCITLTPRGITCSTCESIRAKNADLY
jgi:ribosomal protein L32